VLGIVCGLGLGGGGLCVGGIAGGGGGTGEFFEEVGVVGGCQVDLVVGGIAGHGGVGG
jgi:hypothetical protein